jgi:hypothetical protein
VTAGGWAALLGLGAFHGLNPGMGWLFAVAIGLQERSRAAVLRALGPIAVGHLGSILVVAVAVSVGASALTTRVVAIAGGVLLVVVGMWQLLSKRHFRWVGMRLDAVQLAGWSFLMASVHGAGLMLLPVLVSAAPHGQHAGHAGQLTGGSAAGAAVWDGVAAALVHTAGMVLVAAAVAVTVYQVLGLRILRTAWVNLDRVWAVALLGAGGATLAVALS